MRKGLYIILLALVSHSGFSQSADTTVLSFDAFYELVLQNHPLARQAALLTQQAAQEVRLARGGFDPKIGFNWSRKDFNDTEYYNKIKAGLKVPTWLGISAEAGVSDNQGQYLNPESYISDKTDNQQYYAGISVPIGQGLFIDQRRAALSQAKIFTKMAEAEQISALNKLLLKAASDYWEWQAAFNNFQVMQQSVVLARAIFEQTLVSFEYGEVAAIDTVQAKTSWLSRQSDLTNAKIAYAKASLQLSTHLWNDEGQPVELGENLKPESRNVANVGSDEFDQLMKLAIANHPDLNKIRLKGDYLQVENRLARERLKPQLDLKYTWLDQPLTPQGNWEGLALSDNYKLGVDFSFPLFLRKERAKVSQTRLKLVDNSLEQDYKEREIINQLSAYYAELINTAQLIEQQTAMVANYERIVEAERLNLANGESDIFKLNAQIDKLFESQQKRNKSMAAYQKVLAYLYWAAGIENLGFN